MSSIDPHELNKFHKTAEQWWDPEGEFKTLHQINQIRINYIQQIFAKYFKNINMQNFDILDIGCGGGLISVPIHKLGYNITGLDASGSNIEAATEHALKNNYNIKFINQTAEEHLSHGKKYDVVLCLEVIEHVANVEYFVKTLSELLKKGGVLIVSTINKTIKSYMQAIIMAEYILRWVPKNTHEYSKFLKPSSLVRVAEKNNLNLLELKGMKLDLLTNRWQLDDNVDVNYFAVFNK